MLSRMSSLSRSAVGSLVMLASLPTGAAASSIPDISDFALGHGMVEKVFDDGGWRVPRHSCCHGRRNGVGASGGALGRSLGPRLGNLDSHDDEGSNTRGGGSYRGYADEPVYRHQLLDRPRVYQRDSIGGGYYGDDYDGALQ